MFLHIGLYRIATYSASRPLPAQARVTPGNPPLTVAASEKPLRHFISAEAILTLGAHLNGIEAFPFFASWQVASIDLTAGKSVRAQWRLTVVFSIADPTLGIPGAWAMPANSARPVSPIRSIRERASGCPIRRSSLPSIRRRQPSGFVMPTPPAGELQGPFPIKSDPEAALIHDQRKILDMTATSRLSFRVQRTACL
jgi:hypothetical protein